MQPRRDAKHRGLAGAVRPQHRVDRASGDRQVHTVKDLDAFVGRPDAAQLEQRLAHAVGSTGAPRYAASTASFTRISSGDPTAMTSPKSSTWMVWQTSM